MHALLLGAGSWGRHWLATFDTHSAVSSFSVADPDPATRDRVLAVGGTWFPSLDLALAAARPGFAVNASPPAVHTATNRTLIEAGIPILCEKPIGPNLDDSIAVVREAHVAGVPFMIAENLRRLGLARAARQLVATGDWGTPLALHCTLYRNYDEEKPYLVAQEYPLLEDVAIHYVDLALAFANARPTRVRATAYHPGGGIFHGSPGLSLFVGFANGVGFDFLGHFATRGRETPWFGEWRVECTGGSLEFDDGPIRATRDGEATLHPPATDRHCLDDFLDSLAAGVTPETSGTAYLPVQAVIEAGRLSCRSGGEILITETLDLLVPTP